jgi:16S rRNA (guanine527-N7)-methyltransferase
MNVDLFAADGLRAAAELHGIILSDSQAEACRSYCGALWDWNTRINLTRHTTLESFVNRDLLDSVRLIEHLAEGCTVLDVGSGGGVPGILAAILRPDLSVELCESVGKKAMALQDICDRLELPLVVHAQRVQELLDTHTWDVAVVRAVAATGRLIPWFARHWDRGGELLLIKGPRWQEELQAAQESGVMRNRRAELISEWESPGRDGASVLLRIS